jgi:DNA-binding beta-propeller fold protein YncE
VKRLALINTILILIILVASFFSYFYFVKRDVTQVVHNLLPTTVSERVNFVAFLTGEGKGQLKRPAGLAISSNGRLYVTDAAAFKVTILDLNGQYVGEFGGYGDQPGQFKFPYGIALLHNNIYVADPVLGRITVFDLKGQLVKSITSPDAATPYGFAALTAEGDKLYATDVRNHQVVVMDYAGNVVVKFGQKGEKPGDLSYPNGVAVRSGKVYVADSNNNRIEIFSSKGVYLETWQGFDKDGVGGLSNPRGIAFDSSGKLLVANMMGSKVVRLSTSGAIEYQWGRQGSGEYELFMPLGLAVDKTGKIYVGDNLNARISIFNF